MKQAMGKLAGALIVLLVVAGCATAPSEAPSAEARSGEVGLQDLTATIAPSARMTLAANENFLPPLPEPGNPPPAYPADLLAQQLPPQVLCLRVSIDEAGAVAAVAPLVHLPDCAEPDAVARLFLEVARHTLAGWRYDPAVRCTFEQAAKPDYPTCVGARETPQAVSLTYRFVFEQQDGRGSVRMTP
ncbi:MAG TPA: hypothetical protein VFR30_02405 [Lysobacter sp.]|nr:hypothetical protein [Lysobacter sp.]